MSGRRIEIVEVSPRDGLQNEKQPVSTAQKLELIGRALAAGIRRVEATSFVNPKRVPQMADADAVMAGLKGRDDAAFIGLALNGKGVDRAIAAGCDEINFVVVASDTFNRKNQGVGTEESLAAWTAIARQAKAAGKRCSITIGAAFGCPFEGEVPATRVLDVAERALAAKPDEIALADTIGCGVPSQVTALLSGLKAMGGTATLRCHFHDTRGTGLANVAAAVEAGVDALDASIGGVGGCPFAPAATGNIATEDTVWMLERMGISTGIDVDALVAAAHWLEEVLGKRPPGAISRAGVFPPAPLAA